MSERFVFQRLIKSADGYGGKWWPVVVNGQFQHKAMLYCPNCHKPMSITNHSIDVDGNVGPSVVCPNNLGLAQGTEKFGEKCQFHEFVLLDGWATYLAQQAKKGGAT